MARLRRSDCSGPGIARRRRGRGFEYRDEDGALVTDADTRARIDELAIPPAWRDVWICLDPHGHLQATGIDAAGRKQYLYHPHWRIHRDRRKFEEMLDFARALPRVRRTVGRDIGREDLSREQVLACAVRLLDRGLFRIGSDTYAEQNNTYGIATILREHVAAHDGELEFDYPAKGGMQRTQVVRDPVAHAVVRRLLRRRTGSQQLLAYRDGRAWTDVRADAVNEYLRAAARLECSAKDFRTWNATVLAASAIARRGNVTAATREVAHHLGNTPAVCRASYIDPRVFDRFRSGWVIDVALPEEDPLGDDRRRRAAERAVIDLLG